MAHWWDSLTFICSFQISPCLWDTIFSMSNVYVNREIKLLKESLVEVHRIEKRIINRGNPRTQTDWGRERSHNTDMSEPRLRERWGIVVKLNYWDCSRNLPQCSTISTDLSAFCIVACSNITTAIKIVTFMIPSSQMGKTDVEK